MHMHAMPWLLARHSAYSPDEGVLRSNSCVFNADERRDLRLPRRGIEPRPSGFRDIGSTARPLPLPRYMFGNPTMQANQQAAQIAAKHMQFHSSDSKSFWCWWELIRGSLAWAKILYYSLRYYIPIFAPGRRDIIVI